jgi:predicted permease
MRTLRRDIHSAIRQLLKYPAFTLSAALTLALGIATNTAIFSIVNGWLRPLPVASPDQLVVLAAQQKDDAVGVYYLSYPALADFRKQTDVFSEVFADQIGFGGLSFEGKAEPFVFSYVTGNFFSGLAIQPAAGRLLLPQEGEHAGDAPVIVLSYAYWKKRFHGDPGVIGKQVRLDGQSAMIIGVAQKDFYGVHSGVELSGYAPLSMMLQEASKAGLWTDRSQRILATMARLRTGVTLRKAQSSLDLVSNRIALEYPKTDEGIKVTAVPERLARPVPRLASAIPLISGLFLVLAGLVLLLACMNVANLLLVRMTARRQELSVRSALGATGRLLIQQMLTESLVLSLLGATFGIALGIWGTNAIGAINLGTKLPIRLDFSFDWRVFIYSLLAALFTGFVVGAWPAIRASRTAARPVLQEGGRSGPAGGRQRIRSLLIVAQVAGSLMLLIIAARFVRSLGQAQHMALGFEPDQVVNIMLDPHQVGYDATRTTEFYRELESRVRALPGVKSASMTFSVPMGSYNDARQIYIEDAPLAPGQHPPLVLFDRIDAGYFTTMQTPVLRGRAFTETDNESAPLVAVINQGMALKYWPNEDPLGKRFSIQGASGPFMQIVGVAQDTKLFGFFSAPMPYFYVPFKQNYTATRILQTRTSISPESMEPVLERQVHALDPEMPISDLQTMRQAMAGGNGFLVFRLGAVLTAAMGLLGLVIATVGIYGVVSFAAGQRTREIGVRMALGASRGNILNLVFSQGMRLVFIGIAIGLAAAFALTRAMTNLLVGVTATDMTTALPITLLMMTIVLLACYVPARRAMAVDPIVALRRD